MLGDCKFYGIYRGVVSANNDPSGQLRVKVSGLPMYGDTPSPWALPCAFGQPMAPPRINSPVWVTFEGGDPNWPVWMGQWFTSEQTVMPPSTNYMTLDTAQIVTAKKSFKVEQDFTVPPTVPDPLSALNPVNLEYLTTGYLPITSYKPGNWTESDQTTSGAVAINMSTGNVQQVTMNGDVTSCTVTGAVEGMLMVLRLKEDNTGGHNWTWFTNVVWANGQGAPGLLTGPNSTATFLFEYDGTYWIETSRSLYDSGWLGLASLGYSNGWVNGSPVAQYRRIGQEVQLRGQIKSGTMSSTITTLPSAFRPSADSWAACVSAGAFGALAVYSSGVLATAAGNNADFRMDGITWFI